MSEAQTCDVLVIGGGIAGLVAANRAAELNRRAVVLEKGAAERYLCSSRYTGGTFHVSYTDVLAGEDKLAETIDTATRGFARKDVARAIAKDSSRLVRWLQAEGVKFINLGHYHTFVLAPPSRTGAGLDWEGRGGDVLLRTLGANLEKRGGRIVRGTRARALDVSTPGRIKVEAEQGGGKAIYDAQAVVIADGGFPANTELVRKYISPAADRIMQRNARTATGDGMQMAQAVGAATVGMDCFYGHLLSRDAMTNDKLWPRPYVDALAVAGILVDAEGNRFADEGEGGVYLANAVARLADPLSTSLVFDQAIWDGPGTSAMIPSNPLLPNAGGTLHKAATIPELASLAGMPAERLQVTVDRYNEALDSGTLAKLEPSRRTDRHKAMPIRKPPFYAVPLCTGITNTMGGLAVDQDGAVLDKNDKPIAGLYAAGGATGGLEGGPSIGYVGGLIKAVLGLRAAERIAKGMALCAGLAIAAAMAPPDARAQAYPARAITMVVGFAPGGGTDIVARLVANKMSQGIGQSIVVANVSGASGNIAAQQVATAPPDGYRILFVSSAHSMNAALQPSLPFDAVRDFAPISRIAESLNVIVVHPSLGVSTLAGLIELAKKQPGKLNYGSGGVGTNSHMSTELLRSMAGIDIVNVPYKGAAPLLVATLSGEVQIGIASLPTSLPHIRSGALKALAVTTAKRSSALPDVPTADEAGVRGYEYSVWYGLLAPAGTRAEIVNRLREQAVAALASPEILERLKADGAEPVGSTPAEFAAFLKAEITKWTVLVKKAGIKAEQ